MCWEDIKIGRRLSTQVKQLNLSAGVNTTLVTADPTRVFLAVYGNGINACRIAPVGFSSGGTQGFTVSTTHPFLEFPIDRYGTLVVGQWSIEAAGVDQVVFVVESRIDSKKPRDLGD